MLDIGNSIVAGNPDLDSSQPSDMFGVTFSNGHNIFGGEVAGSVPGGDLENVAGSLVFASVDPVSGGGRTNEDGVVPLRDALDNPALGAALSFDAMPTDQLGHPRPAPGGTLPDLGAAELTGRRRPRRRTNNDALRGTGGANTISGLGGNDRIFGEGGADTLWGNAGSDTFDGGPGNDRITGGEGVDVALFGGTAAVVVDLAAGTARRGAEVDTLSGIEGAAGGAAGDTFLGDGANNWFRGGGGGGRDTFTGGGGRDTYDFNSTDESRPGRQPRPGHRLRPGQRQDRPYRDRRRPRRPGDQAFRFVGAAAFGATARASSATPSAAATRSSAPAPTPTLPTSSSSSSPGCSRRWRPTSSSRPGRRAAGEVEFGPIWW